MANVPSETTSPGSPGTDFSERDVPVRVVRDIIPIWVLIVVVVFVEITVVSLMWPKFARDKDRILSLKHLQQREYADAIGYLQNLVKRDPSNPTYHNDIANAYYNLGRYDEALESFMMAQETAPNVNSGGDAKYEVPDFTDMIGQVYYKKGDIAQAQKYMQEALQKNPHSKRAAFVLGEIEFQAKNYRKATDYFKMVASDPQYAEKVKEYYAKIEQELFAGIK